MAKRRSFNTTAQGAAIRLSDGQICPATPKILAQGTHMPYLGPLHLNGTEALNWVRMGGAGGGRRAVVGLDDVFDIRTATHEELLNYAENDLNVTLDGRLDTEALRVEVKRIYLEQVNAERATAQQKNLAAKQAAEAAARAAGVGDDDEPQIGAQLQATRVVGEDGKATTAVDASADPVISASAQEMIDRSAAKAAAANARAAARAAAQKAAA